MLDKQAILQNVDRVLRGTDFKDLGEKKVGKVRDIYVQKDRIILVSTDRHSSFDRIIAHIPFKGQILNQISAFWFEQTKDIAPNHVLAVPDPNVLVAKKCTPLPVEFVVRGYITGSTATSLWTIYNSGQRDFRDFILPDGMKKNQTLDHPVLTPTTKSDEHDRPVTSKEIVEGGMIEKETWNQAAETALKLFARGQEVAASRGLILVDTKYEMGLDEEGRLMLIDEIHTPDSSRWWKAGSYEERFAAGMEPEYFDKEFLRLWFKEHCDPYKDAVLPEAPREMVAELAGRYIEIYDMLTGQNFLADLEGSIEDRIAENLKNI